MFNWSVKQTTTAKYIMCVCQHKNDTANGCTHYLTVLYVHYSTAMHASYSCKERVHFMESHVWNKCGRCRLHFANVSSIYSLLSNRRRLSSYVNMYDIVNITFESKLYNCVVTFIINSKDDHFNRICVNRHHHKLVTLANKYL